MSPLSGGCRGPLRVLWSPGDPSVLCPPLGTPRLPQLGPRGEGLRMPRGAVRLARPAALRVVGQGPLRGSWQGGEGGRVVAFPEGHREAGVTPSPRGVQQDFRVPEGCGGSRVPLGAVAYGADLWGSWGPWRLCPVAAARPLLRCDSKPRGLGSGFSPYLLKK